MPITWINDAEIDLDGVRVFCRVDFNVPLNKKGEIVDDNRIFAALDTIRYLQAKKARIVLASHLGRPKGKKNPAFSLEPVAVRLQTLLGEEVIYAHDNVGSGVLKISKDLKPGGVMILENLRFHAGEEENNPAFSKDLASLADVYVDDAFGAVHRAHASTEGITHYVEKKFGGLLLKRELQALEHLVRNPKRPFVAVIGGVKVSDKIAVLNKLMQHADTLIIGGAMAYTFLKAQGEFVGASKCEDQAISIATNLLKNARQKNVKVLLPIDHVVAKKFAEDAATEIVDAHGFRRDDIGMDIGPKTRELFASAIPLQGTVFFNGPLGVCEWENFSAGTQHVADAIASSHAYTVVGGGDSVAAINKLGMGAKISHLSTGGGASLEFIQGAVLPGLSALGYYGN